MGDDKSKSRYMGTKHANDHMTVKHIQTELAASKTEPPPLNEAARHLTTAHISEALSGTSKPQVSTEKPAQSVPSSPVAKSEK